MSKRRLLPPGNEDYLDRMGLTEQDKKVYIAVLDSGLVNVGEVCQLTQLSLSETLESVRDLTDLGLIKQGHGRMPRYYASLPFFKETVTIERETIYALDSLVHSINQTKEEVIEDKDGVRKSSFTNLMNKFLDSVYDALIADLIKDSESMVNEVNTGKDEFQSGIQTEKTAVKQEFNTLIETLIGLIELTDQRLGINSIKEGDNLEQYILDRKNSRIVELKKAHDHLGAQITALKNLTKEFYEEASRIVEKIDTIFKQTETGNTKIQSLINEVNQKVENVNKGKETLLAEIVVIRQHLINTAEQGKLTPDLIQSEFVKLNDVIREMEIKPENVNLGLTELSNATMALKNTAENDMSQVHSALDAAKNSAETNVDTISTTLSTVLNDINTADEASLKQLQETLGKALSNFRENLKTALTEEREKVKSTSDEMTSTLDQVVDHWENRLITYFERPLDVVAPFLLGWKDQLKPKLDQFRADSSELFDNELMGPLNELETKAFSSLVTRVQYIKAMLEGRAQDLQSIINHSQTFDYTKSADTSVVVGIPSIYATLVDFIIRTKNRVTVVTPRLSRELIEYAEKLRPSIRVTFVADADPEMDKKLITRLKSDGRMTLRRYTEKDLYGCIRDSEEIIFGYEREGEEIIGLRSSTPSIIGLLEDRLNETVIRNSKPI